MPYSDNRKEHSDPSTRSPKVCFLQSLDRCAQSSEFIHAFYARFMESSEEVRLKFCHTDFERQHRMLLDSLRLIGEATSGEARALREIRERAESHSRGGLDIAPHLYELWKRSLVQTASEHDALWSADVAAAWEEILGYAIACMTRHY